MGYFSNFEIIKTYICKVEKDFSCLLTLYPVRTGSIYTHIHFIKLANVNTLYLVRTGSIYARIHSIQLANINTLHFESLAYI